MTDRLTEDNLRSALMWLAPTNLDTSVFRARLDALMIEDAQPGSLTPGPTEADHFGAADVLPLTMPTSALRSRRSRIALYATIAACAAAVVAVAVAVLPGGRHGDRGRPTSATTVPATFRTMILPRTIVLQTYRGTGSRRIAIPAHAVPRHFEYGALATCSGGGRLLVFSAGELSDCNGAVVFGTSAPASSRTMPITASSRTSWTITLIIQPQARTNGNVQSPPSDPAGRDNGLRHNGRGSASITFAGDKNPGGTPATRYSVRLTCSGTGVRLPDLNGTATNGGPETTGGLVTRTCFPGHEYDWQSVPLRLPHTVRVVASAGTRWTIFLDPAA